MEYIYPKSFASPEFRDVRGIVYTYCNEYAAGILARCCKTLYNEIQPRLDQLAASVSCNAMFIINRGGAMRVLLKSKSLIWYWDWSYFDEAAINGNVDVLMWLYDNHKTRCTCLAVYMPAANGHLEVLKWLYSKGLCSEFFGDAIIHAADKGHFETVKWLYKNIRDSRVENAMVNAAGNGNLEIVKWLYMNKCVANRNTPPVFVKGYNPLEKAVVFNRFDVVVWLHENTDYVCGVYTMAYVEKLGGYDEILVYLKNKKKPTSHATLVAGGIPIAHVVSDVWKRSYYNIAKIVEYWTGIGDLIQRKL